MRDVQWSPSGRCYCRNRASFLTDKGVPEAECPSAERTSSLRKETRQTPAHTCSRDLKVCERVVSSEDVSAIFLPSLTHYETLCVGKFLEDFTKIFIALFVCRTENLQVRTGTMSLQHFEMVSFKGCKIPQNGLVFCINLPQNEI